MAFLLYDRKTISLLLSLRLLWEGRDMFVILTYLLTPWSKVPLEKLTGFCS